VADEATLTPEFALLWGLTALCIGSIAISYAVWRLRNPDRWWRETQWWSRFDIHWQTRRRIAKRGYVTDTDRREVESVAWVEIGVGCLFLLAGLAMCIYSAILA
jgi:hypothetical protein